MHTTQKGSNMPLRYLRDRFRLHAHRYSGVVYDPTYVYAPWKRWVLLAGAIVVIGVIVWLSIAKSNESAQVDRPVSQPPTSSQGTTPAATPEPTEPSNSQTDDESKKEFFNVVKVVDGDTMDVSINGQTERLRLIGIDTPETVDPRKPVQCFGREASDKAKSLLSSARVAIEQDASQGERDKYGRLLVYVFLEDGTNFNRYMIAEGYAHEYTYRVPYKYQTTFKAAQRAASDNEKGLWASSTCNGVT